MKTPPDPFTPKHKVVQDTNGVYCVVGNLYQPSKGETVVKSKLTYEQARDLIYKLKAIKDIMDA